MKSLNDLPSLSWNGDWEKLVLEYAIKTFPYSDSFRFLPGYYGDEREVLTDLVEVGQLKIGFYYEEMLEDLTIFYFLQVYDDTYIVLGLDSGIRVEIPDDSEGVFPLDVEQYLELHQVKMN